MEESFLNNLLAGVNGALSPQFNWGYNADPELNHDELRIKRNAIDALDIERAATLLLGEFMGLTVDEEIFRGTIPAGVDHGFEVMISSEIHQTDFRYRRFDIYCTGRDSDRDKIVRAFTGLAGKLPLPEWLTVNYHYMSAPVTFAALFLDGGVSFSTNSYNANVVTTGSIHLRALISI